MFVAKDSHESRNPPYQLVLYCRRIIGYLSVFVLGPRSNTEGLAEGKVGISDTPYLGYLPHESLDRFKLDLSSKLLW